MQCSIVFLNVFVLCMCVRVLFVGCFLFFKCKHHFMAMEKNPVFHLWNSFAVVIFVKHLMLLAHMHCAGWTSAGIVD